ncbi:MAG: YggS family pyridoxal phosphate-dependent enzyme [Candidatus Acidiferrales bacterium]
MMALISAIAANLERARERIHAACACAGRRTDEITLIAVSKTFPAESIRAAYAAGLRVFGENRVQESETKSAALADLDADWHLIGHLQSNKARRAAQLFSHIDSIDSAALASKLDAVAAEFGKRMPVLIEVQLGGEAAKSGVPPEQLHALADHIAALAHLQLRGLMCVPPFFEDPQGVRPYFAKLRALRDNLAARRNIALPALSMGMSHDFEVAIEEGATEIRIGSALFGARARKL